MLLCSSLAVGVPTTLYLPETSWTDPTCANIAGGVTTYVANNTCLNAFVATFQSSDKSCVVTPSETWYQLYNVPSGTCAIVNITTVPYVPNSKNFTFAIATCVLGNDTLPNKNGAASHHQHPTIAASISLSLVTVFSLTVLAITGW